MKDLLRPQAVGGRPLVRDYLLEKPAALTFYSGSPFSLGSFRAKLDEVNRRFGRAEREAAAAALRPSSARAKARLDRFVEEGGAMVTTGQQAGFLTGPLYTIHKAASTVALAEHLEAQLNVPILPVFWVASEDHDWAEVNHATVVDRKGRLRRIELPTGDPRPLPMSARRLEGDVDQILDDAAQAIGATKNNASLLGDLLDPYRRASASVAEAFGDALLTLFSEVDLLVVDAADPALKRASVEALKTALLDAGAHEKRLAERTQAIEDAAYAPQVSVLERGTNVFYQSEAGRERLYTHGDNFLVRERSGVLKRGDLLEQLADEPGRFSPNVLLRPVVESAVFPTLAYVAGPGEIAYFAQVTALFDAYGIMAPLVVPRFSALIVEPAVERVLDELELKVDDLQRSREELIDQLARREVPDSVTEALGSVREKLAESFEELIEEAVQLDPGLSGALGSIRNRELAWLGRAERKIVQAVKRGDGIKVEQLDRVLNGLRPGGSPQERVLNVMPYLGRYGRHFLKELDRAIQEHWRLPS